MTGMPGRPGRRPKESVDSLEREIKEAHKRLEILRRQEADRVRRELDHARMVVGRAVIEAVARGSWIEESLQKLEGRFVECASRESDQAAVRRAFAEGRRLAEERGVSLDTNQGKEAVAVPRTAVKQDVPAA